MRTTIPKDLREDLARAGGYLSRHEVERALEALSDALARCAGLRLGRAATAELGGRIREILQGLSQHPRLLPLLDHEGSGHGRQIPYQPGREASLRTVLEGLAKILRQNAAHTALHDAEDRPARKKQLLQSGLRALQQGKTTVGRAFLRRIIDEFCDEPDICLQIGRVFSAANDHAEAAAVFEEAMRAQPRESAAYTGAVNAWTAAGEYEKAEAVYKAVLRTFGGHPSTFGKMAAMYLLWDKHLAAEDAARRALKDDAAQADALAVMTALKGAHSADNIN